MKFKNILPILLFFASLPFYGQNEALNQKKEQIKTLKVAFITNELSLSSEEAEKFWPVYNTFDDRQFELRHQKRNTLHKIGNNSLDTMSEKEASALLIQMENTDEELYLLKKKLIYNLKTIISPIKILKLKKAEEDFNRKLLKQYRDKKSKK